MIALWRDCYLLIAERFDHHLIGLVNLVCRVLVFDLHNLSIDQNGAF
jgi:hypothetical protein